MDIIVLIVSLVILIMLGAPIALAMIVLPTVYILLTGAAPLLTVPHQMYEAIAKFPLVAVPFFIFTGELMNSSSVTQRILRLCTVLVGRMPGGLAQVNIVASLFFGGMNGSAVADTATIGTVLIPSMRRRGYSAAYAAAITAISSTIGGILPPSIAMIVLASATNLSVGAVFASGILPGLLIGLLLMVTAFVIARIKGHERGDESFNVRAFFVSLRDAIMALSVPAVLVVGIFGGWCSSVEGGAITSVVVLALGVLVYRDLDFRLISGALERSVRLSALVFVIIAAAGPFTWLLTRLGALGLLETWLLSFSGNQVAFTVAVMTVIFVAGLFMDATANVIVLGPLLVPACVTAGFAPVQAALFVVVGFLLGTVTPPVGVCYFTAAAISSAKLERTAIDLLPFLGVEVLVLFLILLVGPLTLALPTALGML